MNYTDGMKAYQEHQVIDDNTSTSVKAFPFLTTEYIDISLCEVIMNL